MRRLLPPSALVAAFLFAFTAAAAGCSYVNPPAMVVVAPDGGTDYTLSDSTFQTSLQAIAADSNLTQIFAGQSVSPWTDSSKSAYNPAFVTGTLGFIAKLQIVIDAAAAKGVTPKDADLKTAETSIAGQLGGGGTDSTTGQTTQGDPAKGQAMLDSLGSLKPLLIDYVAIQDGFTKATAPSDDELRKVYEGAKDRLTPSACASHILILASHGAADPTTGQPPKGTDEEYAAALAKVQDLEKQLAAGADFATLAKANSEDPGSAAKGGALDCVSQKGSYVAPFDDAVFSQPVGVIGPPVKTDFGYHIILVTKRAIPTFEEVKDQIVKAVGKDSTSRIASAAFEAATVRVDPRYGSWDGKAAVVNPPAGASNPTVVTSSTAIPTLGGPGGTTPGTAPGTTPGSTPGSTLGTTTGTTPDDATTAGSSIPAATDGTAATGGTETSGSTTTSTSTTDPEAPASSTPASSTSTTSTPPSSTPASSTPPSSTAATSTSTKAAA